MKKVYIFKGRYHTAYNRNKFCPKCGGHEYVVYKQIKPSPWDNDDFRIWHIECPYCGYATNNRISKKRAMEEWVNGFK